MRIRTIIICIILTTVFIIPAYTVADTNVEPEAAEMLMFDLVNDARLDPLAAAKRLGFESEQVLDRFPDVAPDLKAGLNPLSWNADLYAAAKKHTNDMRENQYYSHLSQDSSTFTERIADEGYSSAEVKESLGMIAFSNFVPADAATRLIFDNMLRDELQSETSQELKILSPAMLEVGIGSGSGTQYIGGRALNTWLATCDFGRTAVSDLEREMLLLINRIRENPLAYAQSLGMDTDQLLQTLPELNEIFRTGLPPLWFNPGLHAAAAAHAADMLAHAFLSEISFDGRTLNDRIIETGYMPTLSSEMYRLQVTTTPIDMEEGARQHIEKLFLRELSPDCVQRHILDPNMSDAGVAVVEQVPEAGQTGTDASAYYYLLLVCDFALFQ